MSQCTQRSLSGVLSRRYDNNNYYNIVPPEGTFVGVTDTSSFYLDVSRSSFFSSDESKYMPGKAVKTFLVIQDPKTSSYLYLKFTSGGLCNNSLNPYEGYWSGSIPIVIGGTVSTATGFLLTSDPALTGTAPVIDSKWTSFFVPGEPYDFWFTNDENIAKYGIPSSAPVVDPVGGGIIIPDGNNNDGNENVSEDGTTDDYGQLKLAIGILLLALIMFAIFMVVEFY